MAVNVPSIVAWSSQGELDQLKSWFYDPQPSPNPGEPSVDMRQRAINRVQAYQTRSTNLPPEIVSTALLTQSLILPQSTPPLVFRTSMTLALIRFVNSLLDPLQKRDKSLPLSVLAADAGLPTVFVEIRHWGTHENSLPGAEVLKDMGIRALEWLYRNFWNKKPDGEADIAGWRSGAVDIKQVVGAFENDRRACFEDLVVELAGNEDYAISRGIFDPLIAALDARISAFPADFIEYIVDILTTTSNESFSTLDNSTITLKYPETLISWTMHFLSQMARQNSSIQPNFTSVAKQCINNPNTLAWDLLQRILDEKGFVQEHLPYDVVSWITDGSRQETSTSVPSNIDEIEQELNAFRQRMEMDDSEEKTNGEVGWTRGWKKWDGEWIPRPIGV